MADSNLTKQALSSALKELMEEQPFEKISVSDICERCHMNRKSFYYHFKDKYDLANWIFDTEFIELTKTHALDVMNVSDSFEERLYGLVVVCEYFYENRSFYRRILQVEGQNSFSSHFRDFLYTIVHHRVMDLAEHDNIPQMVMDFIVDGFQCCMVLRSISSTTASKPLTEMVSFGSPSWQLWPRMKAARLPFESKAVSRPP